MFLVIMFLVIRLMISFLILGESGKLWSWSHALDHGPVRPRGTTKASSPARTGLRSAMTMMGGIGENDRKFGKEL